MVNSIIIFSCGVGVSEGVIAAPSPRGDVVELVGKRVGSKESHGDGVVPARAVVVPREATNVLPRLASVQMPVASVVLCVAVHSGIFR